MLRATGVKAIAVRERGVSRLMVVSGMPPKVDQHVDLDGAGAWRAIMQAGETLFFGGERTIRAFGKVGDSDKEFELILSDHKLQGGDAQLCPQHRAAVAAGFGDHRQPGVRARSTALMIRPIRNVRNADADLRRRARRPRIASSA